MEIILAEAAGFCFGVKRAVETALKSAESNSGAPIKTLGPLIHNPQVVKELESRGVTVEERPEDIDAGVVIVRCHGIPPKVMDQLSAKEGVTVVDATCPFVKRAMRFASQLKEEGYQIVIVGDSAHPEVKAIHGATGESAWVIDSPQAIDKLPLTKRIGVIAQTTQSISNFQECVSALAGKADVLKAFNTICTATEQRQFSARQVAANVDVMVIIGGRNSANTRRLAEVCQEVGAKTYLIETADELRAEWFRGVKKAGVSAGASTPSWLIEGVLNEMSKLAEEKELEKTAEEVKDENVEVEQTQDAEGQMQDFDVVPNLQVGDIINGTVVQIGEGEVLVDIQYKSEGRLPFNEVSFSPENTPEDVLSVGDEIRVKVLKIDDSEGNVILSKRRADAELAWGKLEEIFQNGSTMEAKVVKTVKGGLLVYVGVRGFIPASQVSLSFEEDLEKYVGQNLELKIIELDRKKNNVVFSHRAVLEERLEQKKKEVYASLKEGDIVPGVVRRITDFGAFVDIGDGVEGLLHVSEMAYSRVSHPSAIVSEDDEIKVMILGLDSENDRISLGLKQTIADPWDNIESKYSVGDVVTGTVTRTTDFGAFVKIEDGVEGLIHISQLAHRHIEKVEEVVQSGDEVEVKVISLDSDAKRIGLSIKELQPKPEPVKAPKQRQPKEVEEIKDEELTTNLGDVFGDLFKNHR